MQRLAEMFFRNENTVLSITAAATISAWSNTKPYFGFAELLKYKIITKLKTNTNAEM